MNKRVWIWNHYAGSMYEEQGGRHYAFAKYLRQADPAPGEDTESTHRFPSLSRIMSVRE